MSKLWGVKCSKCTKNSFSPFPHRAATGGEDHLRDSLISGIFGRHVVVHLAVQDTASASHVGVQFFVQLLSARGRRLLLPAIVVATPAATPSSAPPVVVVVPATTTTAESPTATSSESVAGVLSLAAAAPVAAPTTTATTTASSPVVASPTGPENSEDIMKAQGQ